MSEVLLWLNVAFALVLAVDGLRRRSGYLELPFLMSVVYGLWLLPQAAVLVWDATLPPNAVPRVLLMSLLCLLLCWVGWRLGLKTKEQRKPVKAAIDSNRLLLPTWCVTLFAIGMQLLIFAQPASVRADSQWTGPITIIFFFAQVGVVSLVLSLAMFMQRATTSTVVLAIANLLLYAPSVLIYFRRAETMELVFAVLLTLLAIKRKVMPRTLIVVALVLGFFFINGVGQLRALGGGYQLNDEGQLIARIPTIEEIFAIDWMGAAAGVGDGGASETRNAAMFMEAIDVSGASLGLGSELNNQLVQAYVPAQILGKSFKESLIIGSTSDRMAASEFAYQGMNGSTATGFPQLYKDFWFVGSFVFLIMGFVMANAYSRLRSGSLFTFGLYATTLTLALHAVTHYGYYFMVNAPLPILTLWLVQWTSSLLRTSKRRSKVLVH